MLKMFIQELKSMRITMKTVKSSYGGGSELDQFQSRKTILFLFKIMLENLILKSQTNGFKDLLSKH